MASDKRKVPDPADNYFDVNTTLITVGFLAVYFMVYGIMSLAFDAEDHSTKASFVDVVFFALIIAAIVTYYYSMENKKQDSFWEDLKKTMKAYLNNGYSVLEVVGFLLLFRVGTAIFGIPMGPGEKSWSIAFLESKAYLWLTVLIIIQFFKYIFKIDIVSALFGDVDWASLFETKKDSEKKSDKEDAVPSGPKEEVFNVSNNLYNYEDAKAVCRAMGSRLATYDEIEASYMGGAEWTSYGWSEGQHAYFPTQKATWARLQELKGHEHDLGRPGVNGGYFANPNVRLGVNCYGVRPQITAADQALMDAKKNRVVPKTAEERELDNKVEFWKANKDKLLVLSSFNNNKWSKY
jgi:hypothetical protein